MDISETLAPTSDQLDAVDLLGGPRTFTISGVDKGNAEQPVNVHLAEFPRVWRPGKSMRRVLAFCWGTDAAQWIGRRVELYCDPEVMFGKDKVGGTRIARLSHIDGPKKIPLLVTRGKSATFKVDPLPDTPTTPPTDDRLARIGAGMKARGIVDREDMLAYVESITGRAITAAMEMTSAEMDMVLGALAEPMGDGE